jgi:hypothetical protein
MTQDELIEMWHKAWPDKGSFVRASAQDLESFAKLVAEAAASKERKEMAEHCVEITRMTVDKAVSSAIDKEREACALLAATPVGTIAREISARGEA